MGFMLAFFLKTSCKTCDVGDLIKKTSFDACDNLTFVFHFFLILSILIVFDGLNN